MPKRHWKKLLLVMAISLSILVLLCLKTGTKLKDVADIVQDADGVMIAAAFLISAAIHILFGSYKWLLILCGMGCETTFREVLFVRMGSDPVRFIAPFKTGELSNIAYFWRKGKLSFARSTSWILLDKALNISGSFFWLMVGLGLYFTLDNSHELSSRSIAVGVGLASIATFGGVLFLASSTTRKLAATVARRIHPKLGHLAEELLAAFASLAPKRKTALLFYGILFQLRPLIVCYLLMRAFGGQFTALPSIPAVMAWGSVAVIFSNVPYTQWGTGPREAALMALFANYFQTANAANATLMSIGLLMAVAIHAVPALIGISVVGSFIKALSGSPDEEAES
jgi:glycosyltransferase 2 family protein